jgi:hypothetical protein
MYKFIVIAAFAVLLGISAVFTDVVYGAEETCNVTTTGYVSSYNQTLGIESNAGAFGLTVDGSRPVGEPWVDRNGNFYFTVFFDSDDANSRHTYEATVYRGSEITCSNNGSFYVKG